MTSKIHALVSIVHDLENLNPDTNLFIQQNSSLAKIEVVILDVLMNLRGQLVNEINPELQQKYMNVKRGWQSLLTERINTLKFGTVTGRCDPWLVKWSQTKDIRLEEISERFQETLFFAESVVDNQLEEGVVSCLDKLSDLDGNLDSYCGHLTEESKVGVKEKLTQGLLGVRQSLQNRDWSSARKHLEALRF